MLFKRRSRYVAPILLGLCAPLLFASSVRAGGKKAGSGEQFFTEGKFSQAHEAYASAVKRDPKNISLRVELVRTSLRLDNWKNALSEAQSAATVAPSSADAQGILGLALMRAGMPSKANEAVKKSLALNANDYWGLVAKGRVLLFNEETGAAHEVLRKATDLHPDWPDAYYYLHDSFDEKTPREEREKASKAYLKLKPKGHPHDSVIEGMARDVAKHNPFEDKKNGTVFEATGAIDEKRLKAADEGKEKPVTIKIPFERDKRDNETIILPVSINGIRMRLLFDTGAGHSISVAGPAAERLNLPSLYKTYVRGVSGKEEVRMCRADEMKIGPQSFKNIPVETTPNPIEPEIDGLIGGAVFDDYAVTVDYETDTMILTRGKNAAAPKPLEGNHITTVLFHDLDGYIIVPMKLEDRTEAEWGLLDTGAGGMGVLSYATALDLAKKRNEDEKAQVHIDRRMGIGTTNTGFDAMVFAFPIDLGLVHNGGTPYFMELNPIMGASMIDNQVSSSFDFQLSALVGISYLANAKRVTFDYPHHLLTMEFGPKTEE